MQITSFANINLISKSYIYAYLEKSWECILGKGEKEINNYIKQEYLKW